jgi:hypothetical protein
MVAGLKTGTKHGRKRPINVAMSKAKKDGLRRRCRC